MPIPPSAKLWVEPICGVTGRALLCAIACAMWCAMCPAGVAQPSPAPATNLAQPSEIQLPANPATRLQPGGNGFVPLDAQQRARLFFKGYLGSPVPYAATVAEAAGTLIVGDPDGWRRNWSGYGKRTGTTFALFTLEETIHDTGDAALRLDPRYFHCRCSGVWHRSWHALKMTALASDGDGQLHLDLPRFAGDYAASMIVTTWYPPHYSPLVQGVQMGHVQVGSDVGMNLLREFSPELKRIWQRFKLK
jgi:hypothetical protein